MKTVAFLITANIVVVAIALSLWLLRPPAERFRIAAFSTEELQQTEPSTNNSPLVTVNVSTVHPILKIDSVTGRTWIYRDETYLSSHYVTTRYVGWEELSNVNRNVLFKNP